jgi:hypothetical protein
MSREPDSLTAFTHSLANVPPHPGQLDRDALLFAAGRAAGRRGAFWTSTAAILAVLCTALTVTLLTRPPTVVERAVYVKVPVPAEAPPPDTAPPGDDLPATSPTAPSLAVAEALRLRQRVLDNGVGETPQATWTSERSRPSDDVPDLSSLRLNAAHSDGEQFR